jgi:hypothetical protein
MKVGSRYWSKNSTVQVIVVKGGSGDAALACAGEEMIALAPGTKAEPGENPADTPDADQLLVGKRYVGAASGVEVLCTAAGSGPLSAGGERLMPAQAKLLPSSD